MCHNEGSEKIVRIHFLVNKSKSMNFYEKFRNDIFVENWILNKYVTTGGWKKHFEFSFWWISRNLWDFMKNFARKFIVWNWILNNCVTTRCRKKPFGFIFWWISRNLCILVKIFARNFFCRKSNFEQTCHKQGSKNTIQIQFSFNSSIYALLWKFWTNMPPPGVGKNLSNSVLF